MVRERSLLWFVLLGAATTWAPEARADWPMARHDPQRTGAATGRSDITAPEEVWRYYLGGNLSATGLVVLDIDNNAVEDYVMAAGGSLVAKSINDTVLWTVPPRDVTSVAGPTDLDGDGDPELIAATTTGALVVDGRTGLIEWEVPRGRMGLFGGMRLGDLDGDGLDELVLTEAGTCAAVPGSWPGAVYTFADGASAPRELWAMTSVVCSKGTALTLFDADGDGDLDVLEPAGTGLQVLDGATGEVLGVSADFGFSLGNLLCRVVEADGTPGEELACVHNNAFYATQRSVMLLDFDGAALELVWRTYLSAVAGGEARVADLVTDLGDGPVVIASHRDDASLAWTTMVFDAATGTPRAARSGELVAGTAPRAAGGRYLLTISDAGLRAWRDVAGEPTVVWTHAGDDEPLVVTDGTAARTMSFATRTATMPTTGRVVVVPRGAPGTVRALALDDSGAGLAAEVDYPTSVRARATFVVDGLNVAFAVSRSDGYLTPYDEALVPQAGVDDVQGFGVRTGGYYATGSFRALGGPPRTVDLDDDGRDEIVVVDSREALVRLDPEDAARAAPPRPTWSLADALYPTATTGAEGAPVVAMIERDATDPLLPRHALSVRTAEGVPVWDAPLPGTPLADIAPADLDGDDVPDLVVQWGATGDVLLHTEGFAGATGASLWEDVSDPGAGRSPAGVATGPWPGQPADVVVHVGASQVWALAGATGLSVAQSGALGIYYFLPTLIDVDDDDALEVALTGGFAPIRLLDDDLASTWTSTDVDRPFPYGAVARCGDGAIVLVSQSRAAPPRLKLTTLAPGGSGLAVGAERALWLAGGAAHATEDEALAAAPFLGQLTSSTVHDDLTGAGRPSALVGSSDGWLYAVDPCAATLDFATALDAAVGEAVYGDTDGDGRDEILVTAGDGYLHALRQYVLPAPAWVVDLDVTAPDAAADVDVIDDEQPLAAAWAPVDGATGYQVAVIDADGSLLLAPAWRDVAGTSIELTDLATLATRTYRVLVRAVSGEGRSVDAGSDGVTVVPAVPPPPGPTPDGGCCEAGAGGGAGAAALAGLTLLGLRRRRLSVIVCQRARKSPRSHD